MSGKIENLLISQNPSCNMKEVTQIILEEGKGIYGDRYYSKKGTFSKKDEIQADRDVTLIEIEKITAFNTEYSQNLTALDLRRNIVVSNCNLNDLVGKEFQIGNVILKGIRLCEPCKYLSEKLENPKVLSELVNKAGLRAQIIKGGSIDKTSQIEI